MCTHLCFAKLPYESAEIVILKVRNIVGRNLKHEYNLGLCRLRTKGRMMDRAVYGQNS